MIGRKKADKPNVIIYGLGNQWETEKFLLERTFNIVAYSGHTVRDMDGYITPDEIYNIQFEYIYVTSRVYFDDIKAELMEEHGIKEEAIIGEKELHLYTGSLISKINLYMGRLMFHIGSLKEKIIYQLGRSQHSGIRSLVIWCEILSELKLIRSKKTEEHTVVVIGANKYGKYFSKKISQHIGSYWGMTTVNRDDVPQDMISYVRDINELVYEDIEKLKVYIIDPYRVIKTTGVLLDMGIKKSSIKVVGQSPMNGTRLQNIYDINLGYTWKDGGIPGFVLFGGGGKDNANNTFRIVTLGGSTTDSTLSNIKSWPEILYEKLSKFNKNIEVYNGGISAYRAAQELQKLMRDVVMILKPDMVISYSGINDSSEIRLEPKHPFTVNYRADIVRKCISKNLIRNPFHAVKVSEYTLGLEDKNELWEHWLYCERAMHAICQEYGITFYGVLQPYAKNDKKALRTYDFRKKLNHFYRNTKEMIGEMEKEGQDWLKDFTDIFDGEEKLFYDHCHVYERGNRIIASRMMPYVLRTMRGGREL